jgi:hypothetical protein
MNVCQWVIDCFKPRLKGAARMETITITKADLESAYAKWESDARQGFTRTRPETVALPLQQVAEESADHLWSILSERDNVAQA